MLYAAAITKFRNRKRSTPWLLVDSSVFDEDKKGPFIYINSDLDKLKATIKESIDYAKSKGNFIRIWSRGQGARKLTIKDIQEVTIVPLDISGTLHPMKAKMYHFDGDEDKLEWND